MFRVAHVAATIFGMLICPWFCKEGAGGLAGRHQGSETRCADQGLDASPAAEHPGGCCDGIGHRHPNAPQDPCSTHGCVCKGAVQTRHEHALAAGDDGPMAFQPAWLTQATCSPAASDPFEPAQGLVFASLESGRAARIVLQSLLL